ncbi:hypothetical protein PCE1_000347 [Barthelona sp. PCE]
MSDTLEEIELLDTEIPVDELLNRFSLDVVNAKEHMARAEGVRIPLTEDIRKAGFAQHIDNDLVDKLSLGEDTYDGVKMSELLKTTKFDPRELAASVNESKERNEEALHVSFAESPDLVETINDETKDDAVERLAMETVKKIDHFSNPLVIKLMGMLEHQNNMIDMIICNQEQEKERNEERINHLLSMISAKKEDEEPVSELDEEKTLLREQVQHYHQHDAEMKTEMDAMQKELNTLGMKYNLLKTKLEDSVRKTWDLQEMLIQKHQQQEKDGVLKLAPHFSEKYARVEEKPESPSKKTKKKKKRPVTAHARISVAEKTTKAAKMKKVSKSKKKKGHKYRDMSRKYLVPKF